MRLAYLILTFLLIIIGAKAQVAMLQ
uniref:Uncharacterized protein n=1 Tax=Arundo donax TaxID=35708 RepID=A0A0A8YZ42_ARUDO